MQYAFRFFLGLSFLAGLGSAQPYTISTVAGTPRTLDGASATNVPLRTPGAVVTDAGGNLFISDSSDSRILKVTPAGIISTIAGTGVPGFSGDRGKSPQAQIHSPGGMAIDSAGNLYFADKGNNRVRRISLDGTINTVAGVGNPGSSGDGGLATSAQMRPGYVAVDLSGNLYIAETFNYRVRKVDTKGVISTIAGTGQVGYGGDNGPAVNATLGAILGIAVDGKSNIYLSDFSNAYVRRIDSGGVITTFAGSGQRGYINGGIPATMELMLPVGVTFDSSGNAYIADVNLARIIKVDTGNMATIFAGDGNTGFAGDNGPAGAAEFNFPSGLSIDGTASNLYIADSGNHRVRKIAIGVVTTVAGTGIRDGGLATTAFLAAPDGIAAGPSGQIAIADSENGEIRKFTVGGTINPVGQLNGTPSGVAFDTGGNLFATDDEPYVLKITAAGVTSILAGSGNLGFSGDGGAATSASLASPSGLAVDAAGNVFVADFDNERVRKITASTGVISTIAGNGNLNASGDGALAVNAGVDPLDVALDSKGNLYIADFSNNRVRKVAPDGTITTVAGNGKTGFSGDGGPATLASLDGPSGVAVDAAGNLYIADSFNEAVRRVNTNGLITTIAGNGTGMPAAGDGGLAVAAQLDPWKLAVDANGTVYVSDVGNDRVRALTPKVVTAASASIAGGNNQSGTLGMALGQALAVKVVDSSGSPVFGINVSFVVSPASAATLSYPAAVTLQDGIARVNVTLGSTAGSFTVSAAPTGVAPVRFDLSAVPAVSPTAPKITPGGVVGAGLSVPAVKSLSANSIATIFGSNFADVGTARQVGPDDLVGGRIPTQFAGVCVTVGALPAPIFSVYPGQINIQIPGVNSGAAAVQVRTKCGTANEEKSLVETVSFQAASPEFFYFQQSANGHNPIAAINAVSGVFVGMPGLIAGATFTPAKSKDYVTLFATGFGATNPAFGAGELPGGAGTVTGSISVSVGGIVLPAANVLYAGVTQNAGLYQLNIQLPDSVPDGDQAVVVTIGGLQSPGGAFISVKN